jgi:hypothetical protein
MQWKKKRRRCGGFQVISTHHLLNGVKARLTVEELRTVGDNVDTLNGDLTIHSDSLKRLPCGRHGHQAARGAAGDVGMLALVLTGRQLSFPRPTYR